MTQRTEIDFSKHELIIKIKGPGIVIYKFNGTETKITTIVTQGVTVVTGSYGYWIFEGEISFDKKRTLNKQILEERLKTKQIKTSYPIELSMDNLCDVFRAMAARLEENPNPVILDK